MTPFTTATLVDASTQRYSAPAYNASLVEHRLVHDGLTIIRVQLDEPPPRFVPGQFVSLGLGAWEPRIAVAYTAANSNNHQLIQRAYSLSARMIDDSGQVIHPQDDCCWEFYVALVTGTPEHPAALTPRLFALRPRSRLFVSRHPKGNYTTAMVKPDDDVIFAATGTGEAPHNAMIVDLLLRGHQGRIVSVVGARHRRDLAYLAAHRRLEQLYPQQYRYLTLTTREPENVDSTHANYVGKQYVQQFFASGALEAALGWGLRPAQTQIFVCGNPQMVGAPEHHPSGGSPHSVGYSAPHGLCELLESRGWSCDRPHQSGNVHYEQYGD